MIITETVSSPVISNIAALPSRFKIKASAKAFKILSGFYSEPILAIPRELGANAWDSHVKAKNTDKMFEVHAPNTLEPWFSVRDFGTGLSPEAIDSIYTTYFESTKTSDNDSDGCMGLGSKTPFNYTENFNVTSWYQGKKHVYNCFIDEAGSPNIMHVVSEDSSEPNGLEVKFGVKIADISMWVNNITRAYEPFRYRPIVKGANITYTERKYAHQGNGWGYRVPQAGYHSNRSSYAFMGNYCYPISTSALRSALYADKDNGYTYEQALSGGGFDFFFDIGALEVAPNKEQLQYEENNSTTLAIVAAIKIAVTELTDQVTKSIEVPKTRWEAMMLFEKYNNYNSPYASIRSIIGDISIKFDSKRVTNGNVGIVSVHRETGCITDTTSIAASFQVYELGSANGRFRRTSTYHSSRGAHIYYTNGDSIKSARLRYHLKNKYNTSTFPTCYIITDSSNKAETFFKHKEYFGWADDMVSSIESLPKPPVTPRQKKTIGTDEIQVADIGAFIKKVSNSHVRFNSKPATFDSAGTYYYVDFYYFDPMWNGKKNVGDCMNTVVDIFVDKNLNNSVDTIYGINVKNKGLLKVGKWINIVDVVKKYIDANSKEYEQYLHTIEHKLDFNDTYKIQKVLTRYPGIITNIENKETRKMFQDFLKANTKASSENASKSGFLKLLNIKSKNHDTAAFDVKAFSKILETKYLGLFNLDIDYYSNTNSTDTIYKIINFVDKNS
jgi:hypothetical protein